MRKILTIACLALLIGCFPGLAMGQSTSDTSLQGISPVRVNIEKVGDDLGDDGVTQSDIRIDVEKNLTSAHIPLGKADYPFIDVQVSAIKSSIGFYAYSIDINMYDIVHRTEPGGSSIPASVWHSGVLSTTDADEVATRLKGSLDGLISQFIEDYYSQNMAKVGTPAAPPPAKP